MKLENTESGIRVLFGNGLHMSFTRNSTGHLRYSGVSGVGDCEEALRQLAACRHKVAEWLCRSRMTNTTLEFALTA